MGYTRGHLHERVAGHTRKSSSIYKHYNLQHNSEMPERFNEQFHIIANEPAERRREAGEAAAL